MTTYRAYRIDRRRRIRDATWVEAQSDEQAKAKASELCEEDAPLIEIWQSTRLVDEIDCEDED